MHDNRTRHGCAAVIAVLAAGCAEGLRDPTAQTVESTTPPAEEAQLLGSQRGGHAWFDFCAGKGDEALLPIDPRALVQPGVNAGRAVLFNTAWKDCHIDPLRVGEKAHPKTCGELREAKARGERLMLGNGGVGAGSIFGGDEGATGIPAETYNNLWRLWGFTARPDNFDELVSQRFGMPIASGRNPYPLPGEDPNATAGGSGQLPAFMTHLRTPDGTWTGELGFTCHACHSGAAGLPEEGEGLGHLYGSGNSLHDIGLMAREIGLSGPPSSLVGLALMLFGTSRGTNNAQFANIVALPDETSTPDEVAGWLTSGSTASMDTPAWWNVGYKPTKFADAVLPADAVRVDLAFYTPLFSPDSDAWVRAHAQDADQWIMSHKAPKYPLPVDTALAEAGAVLFHAKDLWGSGDNPVPRPAGGNGSCASCHGVYAERFALDPTFLENPALRGVAGYVTPIEIIGTDPERLEAFNEGVQQSNGGGFIGYPETVGTEQDCGAQNRAEVRGDRKPGYLAPPLHGVWATAPYFHNGSVPDVWGVLDPASRPRLWRRVSTPAREDQAGVAVMGFDVSLARAYDADRLGWHYDVLACGDGTIPLLDCMPGDEASSPLVQQLLAEVFGNVLLAWNVGNAPVLLQWTPQQVENRKIYNTYLFSQGNQGHAFTATLSDLERRAIIEYLKTL